jgi:diguanylate cyclase (GGDEF)-like protein
MLAMELFFLALGALPFAILWLRARRRGAADGAERAILIEAMEATPCNFAVFDKDRYLIACNAAYRELHREGFARLAGRIRYDELMRVACEQTLPAEEVEAEVVRRVAQHENCVEQGFDRLYPNQRWARVQKRRLSTGGVAGFALDITSLKQAQARIEHLARHDPLTALPNREGFRLALGDMLAGGGGALILLDLDHFKEANDRHGHDAGDALLVAVAERLRLIVRPTDVVCRLGGDEFALVVRDADGGAAAAIAARAGRHIGEPVSFRGNELRVGTSIGIALAPSDGDSPDALIRAADLALYQSKAERRGEPRVFDAGLRDKADRRRLLREALSEALGADELALHFQPQRDLATRALRGAEALLRWHSARLGRAVGPVELLEAAAEARILPAVDDWVVAAAVARLAAWRGAAGAPPLLAINVSPASLRDTRFADRVARLLLSAGVDAARLEIEVPEAIAARDIETVRPTLVRLHEVGVRLALDDFGAGLSSLQHVVSLPVDRLKLDRSIVADLDGPSPPRAVLRATLALARGMGIDVIAEGVETEAQAFALRREGVTVAQGWLTGRPVPEELLFRAGAQREARPPATAAS